MENRNFEDQITEIKYKLSDTSDRLSKSINKALEKIETDVVKEKVYDFKGSAFSSLQDEIKNAISVLESPIHVGFLGRYSHGKTSLINSLFRKILG